MLPDLGTGSFLVSFWLLQEEEEEVDDDDEGDPLSGVWLQGCSDGDWDSGCCFLKRFWFSASW